MDRVEERRPVSPFSTTNRSSTTSADSRNSRDSGKPRRSYYRLFPSVEPTPPASPVSLHHQNQKHNRASLRNSSAGGSYQRRSSSEDNGRGAREPRDPQLLPQVSANLFTSPQKDARKGILPELPPLRTVQEDGHVDGDAFKVRTGLNAVERRRGARALSNHNVAFNSALGQSTEVSDSTAAAIDSLVGSGQDEGTSLLHTSAANATSTNIGLGLGLDLPPTISLDSNRPHSQGHISSRTKPRPNLRIAILDQNNEAKPEPPLKSARHLREGSGASSLNGSMHSQPTIQDGTTVREVRASVALKQSIVSVFKVRELKVARQAGRLRAPGQLSPTIVTIERPGSRSDSRAGDNSDQDVGPQVPSKSSVGRWGELPSLHSRFSNRAATPEPNLRAATPDYSASIAIRPATSQGPISSIGQQLSSTNLSEVPRSVTPSSGRSALATARANVAALSNIEIPTWNASLYEQTKTPGSDLGSLPSAPLKSHGVANPVKRLAELAEQCEALHARQATLRSQRQELSSGIIASLKDSRPGADYGDMVLHEQLALAAVSSSLDICFAKLKSIECQREDAIASLIAQASSASRLPEELARMSRKSSLAPSMDLESRLTTVHPTPDLHAFYRPTRPSSIKTSSYRGDSDDQQASPPLLLPRTSSLAKDPIAPHDHDNEDQAPPRPSSRLKYSHESPETPQSSFENGDTPSTAADSSTEDSTQPSDIEDTLEEEQLPLRKKPQPLDANGNSVKAVKVLGIGIESGSVSPALPSPLSLFHGAMRKKTKTPPKLKLELSDAQFREEVDKVVVSPLTSSSTVMNAEENNGDHLSPSSAARHDLELQLQSFPSAPGKCTPLPPSLPPLRSGGGSSPEAAAGYTTTTATVVTEKKVGRTKKGDDDEGVSPVQRSDTGKYSTKSAHTINVYYDSGGRHEDEEEMPALFS